MIQTHDGKVHETKRAAVHHLEKVYADNLLHTARPIAEILNSPGASLYKVCTFITDHLSEFELLQIIQNDMQMMKDEEE